MLTAWYIDIVSHTTADNRHLEPRRGTVTALQPMAGWDCYLDPENASETAFTRDMVCDHKDGTASVGIKTVCIKDPEGDEDSATLLLYAPGGKHAYTVTLKCLYNRLKEK